MLPGNAGHPVKKLLTEGNTLYTGSAACRGPYGQILIDLDAGHLEIQARGHTEVWRNVSVQRTRQCVLDFRDVLLE